MVYRVADEWPTRRESAVHAAPYARIQQIAHTLRSDCCGRPADIIEVSGQDPVLIGFVSDPAGDDVELDITFSAGVPAVTAPLRQPRGRRMGHHDSHMTVARELDLAPDGWPIFIDQVEDVFL